MHITSEIAAIMITNGFEVVKDSKSKPVHKLNKVTGDSVVEYKSQYFLEDCNNRAYQVRITASLAKKLAGKNIKEAADLRTLAN